MRLEQLGKLSHGVTLSRIQAKPGEESVIFDLFTMQELSKETGNFDLKIEAQQVTVSKKRIKDLMVSNQGMVVIGLTSYKALVLTKGYENRIIPSNFAYLQCDYDLIDPYYIAWYFNEHPAIQKQLMLAMQGSIIRAISVQMLRELEVDVPSLDIQKKVGNVYRLKSQRQTLIIEKQKLEEQLMNQLMIQYLMEEV